MQDNTAIEFFETVVEGQDGEESITLEHSSGMTLEDLRVTAVNKRVLASVVQKLPSELFEAVEESDNPDEAEEQLEEQGMGIDAVTEDTVAGFEELCAESLEHDGLTESQIKRLVGDLDFEILFELGSNIIEKSFENSGDIKDFHERQ